MDGKKWTHRDCYGQIAHLVHLRIHELCGKTDFQPVITNVRYDGYDAETILAFCHQIKLLNQRITELEKQ